MKSMPDCVSVFILPPSFEELEHRLRGRGTETEDRIEARLETAKRELPYAPQYDYQIVNGGDLEEAYQELRSCISQKHGQSLKRRRSPFYGDILEEENPICL